MPFAPFMMVFFFKQDEETVYIYSQHPKLWHSTVSRIKLCSNNPCLLPVSCVHTRCWSEESLPVAPCALFRFSAF